MSHVNQVKSLASDFWNWRSAQQPRSHDDIPRIERPTDWVPQWSKSDVENCRVTLKEFDDRLAQLFNFSEINCDEDRSESWMRANHFEEHSIQNALKASEKHLESVKRAIRANIPMVNGTDYPPGDLVDGVPAALHELYLMHDAGLTVQQTLASISTTAAALLNQSATLGQIAPNYIGDFITVPENPFKNLDTLREISSVYQGGSLIKSPGI